MTAAVERSDYQKIYVPLDNSEHSGACIDAAVSLGAAYSAELVGSHVYAARMHERRFRQMEATLPEEYLEDDTLEYQREVHDSLIALGLQLISDSYLDTLERRSREAEVAFSRKTFDGKNWERLVEDINSSDYDLVVMGARGHGVSRSDTVGSVCMRVLRRIRTDTLVVKRPDAFADGTSSPIVVALDGSQEAFGALRAAISLGTVYDRPVQAVAAYDPYFHYTVFHSMVEVLSDEAARVFRFEEQERLHEEITDTGLARLYQTQLDVARRVAEQEGVQLETTLLAGRAADELLEYVEHAQPWLLMLGRIGAHSREGMDMGSVTEHLLRFAPCNLLVASRRFRPPLDLWAESTLRWTEEAEGLLGRAPAEFRGAVRLMVQRVAAERGHTVATASLVGEAMASLRPGEHDTQRMGEAALAVAVEALREAARPVHLCPRCGYAARDERPVACPVCQCEGNDFLVVDPDALEAAVRAQGGEEESTFDGRSLRWAGAASVALEEIADDHDRRRARLRIEKAARLAKTPVVTLEFALRHLPGSRR
jgi:nucleotide-binding universal stress UspA family protein